MSRLNLLIVSLAGDFDRSLKDWVRRKTVDSLPEELTVHQVAEVKKIMEKAVENLSLYLQEILDSQLSVLLPSNLTVKKD